MMFFDVVLAIGGGFIGGLAMHVLLAWIRGE